MWFGRTLLAQHKMRLSTYHCDNSWFVFRDIEFKKKAKSACYVNLA